MMVFWDTSAFLSLIFDEPKSELAAKVKDASLHHYAWSWLEVEAHAGLSRRRAKDIERDRVVSILQTFHFVDIPRDELREVIRLNRDWRLRASDAGHLYCFEQASFVFPDMQLICFDDEMLAVARKLSLALWQPPPPPAMPMVRESGVRYGKRRRKG